MAADATTRSSRPVQDMPERLAMPDLAAPDLAAPDLAREALDRYPWPLVTRVAAYVAIAAGVASTLITMSPRTLGLFLAALGTGILFAGTFYLLCERLQMRLNRRVLLVFLLVQVAGAVVDLRLCDRSDNMGPLILLFVIAVELQFLAPFRLALLRTAVVWVVAVVAIIVVADPRALTLENVLSTSATTLAGFVFVAAFTRSAVIEVVQRHQTSLLLDELNSAHAQLQRYVDSVEELAVARERNRMAREIHDTLGHYLTVINVQLETAQKVTGRDPARGQEALDTAKRLASECLGEVRRSVAALRPAALDEVPLPEAIGHLVEEMRHSRDITIHIETCGAYALPPAIETTVYRVIQEAMTNVRKHAAARNMWLRMEWGPAEFTAVVRDDGRGAALPADDGSATGSAGFGLIGMRERVVAVGGTLETITAPGAGFCVTLRVPMPRTGSEAMQPQRMEAPAR